MESTGPAVTLLRPPPSNFVHCVDREEHCYCTYVSFGSLIRSRHSLETHGHCQREEKNCTDKYSLSTDTNKGGKPPLLSSGISRSPFSLTTPPLDGHQRSLTDAATIFYNEMTAFVTEAPGSPPGLTGSKSSKSSSFHTSSLSGAEGILSDITHFEDIGLEEESHPLPYPMYNMEKPLRPIPHPATTDESRGSAAAITARRELTNASNRPHALRWQAPKKGHNTVQSLSLSSGMGPPLKRGLRSPSTPSLAITAMSNRNRSRSPSPNTLSPLPRPIPSPASLKRPSLASSPNPKDLPVRRGSWQPSRKSIKEIEAEYDDLDEDLPDDASLWNVPLSPRPPAERTPISPSISPRASPHTSPERPSYARTSFGVSTAKPPMTAPTLRASSPLSRSLDSPPTSPKRSRASMVRGASTGTMPDNFAFPPLRTKSWTVALAELSEEAKSLTEAFESHAEISEQEHEAAVQTGDTSVTSSKEKLSRSRTSIVELPPLRINNVMIDPLPVSKEKEKVLSRTRPSWLPPKSQKEEKKHLKEYQRMMEFSLEAGMISTVINQVFLLIPWWDRAKKGH